MPHQPPTHGLLVCTGKDCRHDAGFRDLITLAAESPEVRETGGACAVPCQSLCNGPVVGCRIDGELRWFTKVRSAKRRKAVSRMLRTGKIPGRLLKRESRKRRGELRGGRKLRPLSAP